MLFRRITAGLLANLASASTLVFRNTTSPCDALITAGLQDRVLLPADLGYDAELETWFAVNARMRPWCLVLPQDTAEVALSLTALLDLGPSNDWHIALRSGGHGPAGFNNIVDGVTIDLSHLNATTYDPVTNVASLRPGARWRNVYGDLDAQGVVVVGGRDGDVGVGGFLLGGGISYFTPRYGLGCDPVINYEVVLTNGSVVNANATANADLWRALKGGGSNFGIVTRYDVEALPTRDLLMETRYLDVATYADVVVDTIVEFTRNDESLGDNALVTLFMHDADVSPDSIIDVIYVNTVGDAGVKTAYDKVRAVPAIYNVTAKETMAEVGAGRGVTGGGRSASSTCTFANDAEIISYAFQQQTSYTETLNQRLGSENYQTAFVFQALPSYLGRLSDRSGGNMLDLDRLTAGALLWDGGVEVSATLSEEDFAFAEAGLKSMLTDIESFIESKGATVDFVYMNYAASDQNPLGSYGTDNIEFIRQVAAKYDPLGAFQTRIPGGFKISKA